MATQDQIKEIRGLIQESVNQEPWTDEFLGSLIDRYGVDRAAQSIWKQKSASYVEIVSISEGGSSRSSSDIHKNALAMVEMLGKTDSSADTTASSGSRTRQIRRF